MFGVQGRAGGLILGDQRQWAQSRVKTYHNVDDEDRNVAQRTPSSSQVAKGLMTGCIDDEQSGDIVLHLCTL